LPSNAYTVHLRQLLQDAVELARAHTRLRTGAPGRQRGLASLNRAAVVLSVSAWESYIEELMRESLQALLPPGGAVGAWPALSAYVLSLLGRFNTPDTANVDLLIQRCIGIPNVSVFWGWQNCTSAQAIARLDTMLVHRHEIAHGVNPRPIIHYQNSSSLPLFVRNLARCTDQAVRGQLVGAHHVVNPWPP
jgi:hypothetical protein